MQFSAKMCSNNSNTPTSGFSVNFLGTNKAACLDRNRKFLLTGNGWSAGSSLFEMLFLETKRESKGVSPHLVTAVMTSFELNKKAD